MKSASITFLQIATILAGIVTLAALIRFPMLEGRAANLDLVRIYSDPFILYAYAASVFFFVGLYKAFRLLGYLRKNRLYSPKAVNAIKAIKYCAVALGISIVVAALFIVITHDKEDDAAGFLALCIVTALASAVVAVAAAKFEKHCRKNADLHSGSV